MDDEQDPGALTSLICSSHSPLLYCYAREPERWVDLQTVFSERKAAIEAFAPDVVIAFTSDHFNGFFLDLMPSFCVGTRAEAINDIGGFPGQLNVPERDALSLAHYLRAAEFDVAVSLDMKLDHAISQTLTIMLGGLDTVPVVPVFINCINPPFVAFKRSRQLGEAIGRFAMGLDKRVLFLGSGGLSHNPTRYYPSFGTGESDVTAYQLTGGSSPDALSKQAWLARLESMHIEGAQMLVDGSRTKADLKLNDEIDRAFLDLVTEDNLRAVDTWVPEDIVATAGIGWMEMHTWIASIAANRAAGGGVPVVDFYSEMLELGISAGVAHA